VKPWVKYSLIRLGVFAVTFAVLLALEVQWWLAALIAAVIGFCVAYVFFGKLRDAVAHDLQTRRSASSDKDGEDEDIVF
jgi:uncharacterized membrane protein YjjB (DUF3815 family)